MSDIDHKAEAEDALHISMNVASESVAARYRQVALIHSNLALVEALRAAK